MILRMSPVFKVMVLSVLTKVSEAKNSVNICDFSCTEGINNQGNSNNGHKSIIQHLRIKSRTDTKY